MKPIECSFAAARERSRNTEPNNRMHRSESLHSGAPVHKWPGSRGRESGNALVETVVVATVLTPMLLLLPTLSKTADVGMSASQAVRYGAWEQTVAAKKGAVLATEMHNRFFSAPELGIRSKQGALTSADTRNNYWSSIGTNESLLGTERGELALSVTEGHLGGTAGEIETVISKLGDVVGGSVSDSEWGLEGGFYTVRVGLPIENDRVYSGFEAEENCQQTASTQLSNCIRQRGAILVDSWSASGPDQVRRRVRSLAPAAMFEPLGDGLSRIGLLPLFQELKHLDGAFGKVEPDVLPLDRYGEGSKR